MGSFRRATIIFVHAGMLAVANNYDSPRDSENYLPPSIVCLVCLGRLTYDVWYVVYVEVLNNLRNKSSPVKETFHLEGKPARRT